MGKKSLENFCNNLFVNLTEGFVFYIPENSFFNSIIDQTEPALLSSFFEKVIIMDWHKGPLMYAKSSVKFNELKKVSLFNKNILALIEKKTKLESQGFHYVFDKYFNQVKALYLLARWLNDSIRLQQAVNTSDNTIQDIKTQKKLLENHIVELNKIFRGKETVVQEQEPSTKNLELQVPILLDQLNKIESNQLTNSKIVDRLLASTQKQSEKTKLPKKPKKLLISETEAEEFILASTFGIKLQQ